LTLAVPADGKKAYLLLQNNNDGIIAEASNEEDSGPFYFVQDTQSNWQTCLGDCSGNLGLVGGIRELVLRNLYIKRSDAILAKNMQFTYAPDFKAYFRFQDNSRFNKDEFVDRTWTAIKPSTLTRSDLLGRDLIPNDVCPTNIDQKQFLQFTGEKSIESLTLPKALERENYEYSFSMTFMSTGTTCFTKNPSAAASYCNLFLVEEVFMIYFESQNMMKVYFFASKNYYESASKTFFVPSN
jgi:hypothetical protein